MPPCRPGKPMSAFLASSRRTAGFFDELSQSRSRPIGFVACLGSNSSLFDTSFIVLLASSTPLTFASWARAAGSRCRGRSAAWRSTGQGLGRMRPHGPGHADGPAERSSPARPA